ncbi:MAG: hypothetical protein JRI97_01420 [Deltaproteobacteria bacterium]|nr:hypothetical protein [Deltaproteobacteria bacterium]
MRTTIVVLTTALVLAAAAAAAGEHWIANVNAHVGNRLLESKDWEPADDLLEFGIDTDFGRRDWPVRIALAAYWASEEERVEPDPAKAVNLQKFELDAATLHLGVRKYFPWSRAIEPYIGGGLALMYLDQKKSWNTMVRTSEETVPGFYLGGGLLLHPAPGFNLGLAGKWSWANAEVVGLGIDSNAGGFQFGVLVGAQF